MAGFLGRSANDPDPAALSRLLGQSPAVSPLPNNYKSQDTLLSTMVYHIDKLANPDTVPKPGTLDGVRRMEEILAYVARFFDNHHVALRPGVVGKNLALGLKAMNDWLRPLYDNYRIPAGFANRI